MGKPRLPLVVAALFVCVALFYFVMPFSVGVAPTGGWFGYAPAPDVVAPESIHARLDCSGPWRQIVDPPSERTKLDKSSPNWTQVANDRQPLCRDAGRSRAIVAGWLIAAAVAVLGLTGAWRSKRRGPETEPEHAVVDTA